MSEHKHTQKPVVSVFDDPNVLRRSVAIRNAEDARLRASNATLLEALEGAMRIRDLWGAPEALGRPDDEHEGEYRALALMEDSFRAAIAQAKGEGRD